MIKVMASRHTSLAEGRWRELTLLDQLGNVGSEVGRALRWRGSDDSSSQKAIDRALELLDLTLVDPRWRMRLKELVRAREMLCDAVYGSAEHGSTLADLNRYFLQFALAARPKK